MIKKDSIITNNFFYKYYNNSEINEIILEHISDELYVFAYSYLNNNENNISIIKLYNILYNNIILLKTLQHNNLLNKLKTIK